MQSSKDKATYKLEELLNRYRCMPFEEALNDALSLRSDDFGHDCSLLLQAESHCLQYFGEQFLTRIKAERDKLKIATEALEFYADKDNWHLVDLKTNAKMVIASIDTEGNDWLGGKKARQALEALKSKGE